MNNNKEKELEAKKRRWEKALDNFYHENREVIL